MIRNPRHPDPPHPSPRQVTLTHPPHHQDSSVTEKPAAQRAPAALRQRGPFKRGPVPFTLCLHNTAGPYHRRSARGGPEDEGGGVQRG